VETEVETEVVSEEGAEVGAVVVVAEEAEDADKRKAKNGYPSPN